MRLLIDLGNSRLKWALSGAGAWRTGAVAYRGQEMAPLLDDAWADLAAPAGVVLVSVAAEETRAAIEEWIRHRWSVLPCRVKPQPAQLGVVNRYRDPATLGADRWAALIGAHAEMPGEALCVISCGTATTIDALRADGEFVGGVIIPGLGLLRGALTGGTAGIRVADGDETSCLARSTADAVAAGTLYGLVGAIERVCREIEQGLDDTPKLIITGGDADRVAAHLERPAKRIPDLVLRGLDRIGASL